MLSELAIEREDSEALMKLAGKTGDGVISFDEFKTLMLATTRPNSITRVSMMAPGIASGVPHKKPCHTLRSFMMAASFTPTPDIQLLQRPGHR